LHITIKNLIHVLSATLSSHAVVTLGAGTSRVAYAITGVGQ